MNNRFVELFTELINFFENNATANPINIISTLAERIATIEEQRDKAEAELKRLKLSMRTLTCQTDINMEALMDVERMTKDILARELAEKLVQEMTIEENFDHFRKVKNVRASITILGGIINEL